MARDDYWNRGRREELRSPTALDTVERILGISSNIADTVRQNREVRADSIQRGLSRITGPNGINYKSLYGVNDDAKIKAIKDSVLEYKDRVYKADADTIDLYNYILKDIDSHQMDNTDYRNQVRVLDSLFNRMEESMETYYNTQSTIGDKENTEAYENMKKIVEEYSGLYNVFFSKHADRVKADIGVQNTLKSIDVAANFAMEQYISGDQWAPLNATLKLKNPGPTVRFRQKESNNDGTMRSRLNNEYLSTEKNIRLFEGNLQSEGFRFSPEQIGNGVTRKQYEQAIDGMVDDGSMGANLGTALEIFTGNNQADWSDKNTWGEHSGLSNAQMYNKIYYSNQNVQGIQDAEKNLKKINNEYRKFNNGYPLIPDETFDKPSERVPSTVLVEDIENFVSKKKGNYPFLKGIKSNNIRDIQTVVKEKLEEEGLTEKAKNSIKSQYNLLLNLISDYLSNNKEAKDINKTDLDSFYSGKINKFQ